MWGMSQPIHKSADMLPAMAELKALQLLHVDDTLLVVDKPAGMLSVPGLREGLHDNLTTRVQALFSDARVVHRLDQATSGLMLFARGAAMQRLLSMAFEARQVEKDYVAVVIGQVAGESGSIDLPLLADWPNRPRQKVDVHTGKPALTHWQVLARSADTTRLALQPITGRTHQLRVHLQAIGHPIVGDTLYAPDPSPDSRADPRPDLRLLLHATKMAFMHPLRLQPCAYTSAPPF